MFLKKLKRSNPELLAYAMEQHQLGNILPDTYILDYDAIIENAKAMINIAKKEEVSLFFMLKQIGRNPLIAKALVELGFDGCVAVDFNEALTMIENDIPLGNVGHLVQIPKGALKKIIASKPKVITVYSLEKIIEINKIAKEVNVIQPLLLRISDLDADLYSGQVGGFLSSDLPWLLNKIEKMENVTFGGFTIFPALLYNAEMKKIDATKNLLGIQRAVEIANQLGYEKYLVNLPSATCCDSISRIKELGGNSGEPGHALTGTTPLHKDGNAIEKLGYVYVSEISHNYQGKSYCYGGGHYRRGHLENVYVGSDIDNLKMLHVECPSDDSIDYHFEIEEEGKVSDTAIMCFRAQVFTTRSRVLVVKGLKNNQPEQMGFFSAIGTELKENWK